MATKAQMRNLEKARAAKSQKSELRNALLGALEELGIAPQAAGRTVAATAAPIERPVAKPAASHNGRNADMTLTFVRTDRLSKGGKVIFEGRDEDNGYLGAIYLDPEDEDRSQLTVTIS